MDPLKIQQLLEQNRIDNGQRVAQMASNIKPPDYTNDSQIMAAQAERNRKIQELYEHDKMLNDHYANPNDSLYMADPYAREKARAIQSQGTVGEIGDINNVISNRQTQMDKGASNQMDFMKLMLAAGQSDSSSLQNELENAIKLQEINKKDTQDKADQTQLSGLLSLLGLTPNGQGQVAGASTNSPNLDAVKKSLEMTMLTNPRIAPQAKYLYDKYFPVSDNFGSSADEYAAGVAGLPKNATTNAIYQKYILDKTKKENTQIVTDPLRLFGLLGGQRHLIDKNTGAEILPPTAQGTSPSQSPAPSTGIEGWFQSLLNNLPHPNNNAAPDYFIPD